MTYDGAGGFCSHRWYHGLDFESANAHGLQGKSRVLQQPVLLPQEVQYMSLSKGLQEALLVLRTKKKISDGQTYNNCRGQCTHHGGLKKSASGAVTKTRGL